VSYFQLTSSVLLYYHYRFAKAVEEVERIRQRFIAKAQLPILGSVSNVEKVSSSSTMNVDLAAARDIYNNIHHNMSSSHSTSHVGAKVRKTGNGMLFSSRGSFHIDDAPSFAGDLARHSGYSSGNSGSSSGNISRQNSKRSDKYATHSGTNTTSSGTSGSDKLSIQHPDETNNNSNYPPLSPAKPNAYLPKRQGSYTSPKVDNISSADSVSSRDSHRSNTSNGSNFPNYPAHNMHVLNTIPDSPSVKTKSIRQVPLLNSGSIENLNPYHNYPSNNTNTTNAQYDAAPYVNPFEAFERANAARIVKVGTFENPSEDELGQTRKGNRVSYV